MILRVLFILYLCIEITLFLVLGALMGFWGSIGVVLGTAVLGLVIILRQSGQALAGLRTAASTGADPSFLLAGGLRVVLAGILLIMPGFLTDIFGILLLLGGGLGRPQPQRSGKDDIIDAEFVVVDLPGHHPKSADAPRRIEH